MFGAVKITEDPSDSDHNKYNGYGIAFDEGSDFSFGNIVNGKNVIIFGADMSFSSHGNRQNEIYVLGKDFIQGVTTVGPTKGGATIYAEKLYIHNFTEPNKKFVLSLHYNGDNSYLFVNGGEELKFKTKAFTDQIKQNNEAKNPYCKTCTPDIVKNISVKVLDLISQKNVLKTVSFHESCNCGCLLDEKVCNNKQRWNKEKCRCECLEIKECDDNSFWNVVNCKCEFKEAAKLIVEEEECDLETNDNIQN